MSEITEFTRHLGHYLPAPDVALVERAFEFSETAHRGQFRKSGEPYITHPLAVASILSQWRIDAEGLAAALLHDAAGDGARCARDPDQARRPVAQHAHARCDGACPSSPHCAGDARHLRADRESPRSEFALPRAAGPVVQASLSDALSDTRKRDQG